MTTTDAREASADESQGGRRPVAARWVVTATVRAGTPVLIGSGAEGATDAVLARDPVTGACVVAASGLAGALRSHLADVLAGYGRPEPAPVATLFGAEGGTAGVSPLVLFDQVVACERTEIRDRVRLDPATGHAAPHGKFDLEVLPAGATWGLRCDLVVPSAEREPALLALLVAALGGLCDGSVRLGAVKSRGLGAVAAGDWRAHRFDLATREGWLDWALSDHDAPLPAGVAPRPDPREAVVAAGGALADAPEDRRRRVTIAIQGRFPQGVLFGAPPEDADEPDIVGRTSAGDRVAVGTGVAGAVRHQALRVAATVLGDEGALLVESLFGPVTTAADRDPRASRVRVEERPLDSVADARTTRFRGDALTGSVHGGLLFDEELPTEAAVTLRLELREPAPAELGLLLLVCKDLSQGLVHLGGTGAAGRGRFKAERVTVEHRDGAERHVRTLELGQADEWADSQIAALRAWRPPPDGEGSTREEVAG